MEKLSIVNFNTAYFLQKFELYTEIHQKIINNKGFSLAVYSQIEITVTQS